MVSSLVERATSDMLIGPDWAMNIEICDMINHDPGQAKDVVKGIKKRLGSRNSKVQLLALTLLETIIKNCGDIVHLNVAEKDVLHDMVKIVKKKHDLHVREKILILIDTWQEAFGGSRARYPQYYTAYMELMRYGVSFPQRSEKSTAPVFTPPQSQPILSYPQNLHNSDDPLEVAGSSTDSQYPTLSLTEIQNARGIMDVLSEMLNALDPGNKEGLGQEVIVDLVEQCRGYKRRVVHLVNSTSDESLLSQGLLLNDELERLLGKHEAIASTTCVPSEKPNSEPVRTLVDVLAPLVDAADGAEEPSVSASSTSALTIVAPPANVDPRMDLLSGDDYRSPKSDNPLALVLADPTPPANSQNDQNALEVFGVFSETNPNNVANPWNNSNTNNTSQFKGDAPLQNHDAPQNAPGYDPSVYAPNSQSIYGGGESIGGLPRPPWEEAQDGTQSQGVGSYIVPMAPYQVAVDNRFVQMGGYGYGSSGYGYGQQVNESNSGYYPGAVSTPTYINPRGKALKAEDKLFGELVDLAKVKTSKPRGD